jgi:amidase
MIPPENLSQHPAASAKRRDQAVLLAKYVDWHPQLPSDTNPVSDLLSLLHAKLTDEERSIVALDATAIVDQIASRKWTSVQVFTAFAKAAVAAHLWTNCLTEIFIEEGLARAKELDDVLEKTGQVVGPLHGLPVSIKDHILIKNYDTSTGYVAWANKTIAQKDAVVVALFRRAGAILYVKTANPQSLLVRIFFWRVCAPMRLSLISGSIVVLGDAQPHLWPHSQSVQSRTFAWW